MKFNVNKQEDVVKALYQFLENDRKMPHNCTTVIKGEEVLTVSTKAVRVALDEIMNIFGYTTKSIQ